MPSPQAPRAKQAAKTKRRMSRVYPAAESSGSKAQQVGRPIPARPALLAQVTLPGRCCARISSGLEERREGSYRFGGAPSRITEPWASLSTSSENRSTLSSSLVLSEV